MNPHQQLIDDLRSLANFLEDRPTLRLSKNFDIYTCVSPEEMKDIVRMCGTIEKKVENSTFDVVKRIGGIKLTWFTSRENVCKRIKVGEKIVPAQEARTIEIEAKPETVEAIYKWECPDSLLRPDAEDNETDAVMPQAASEAIEEANLPATAQVQTMSDEEIQRCEDHQANLDAEKGYEETVKEDKPAKQDDNIPF